MVDARDLNPGTQGPCGFKSAPGTMCAYVLRIIYIAGWSRSVARRAHNPKVAGSNPAPATNYCGGVAQMVRACGSYPQGQWFKSTHRHQFADTNRSVKRAGGSPPIFIILYR